MPQNFLFWLVRRFRAEIEIKFAVPGTGQITVDPFDLIYIPILDKLSRLQRRTIS